MKGRIADAHSILKEIARLNKTELPAGVLVSDYNVQLQENSIPSEDTQLLTSTRKENRTLDSSEQSMGGFSSLLMLLSPRLLKSTMLLWIYFFGNAFAYYGLVLLTTELSNGRNKCSPYQSHLKKTSDINYGDVFVTSFAGKVPCHISTFLLLGSSEMLALDLKLNVQPFPFTCYCCLQNFLGFLYQLQLLINLVVSFQCHLCSSYVAFFCYRWLSINQQV